MRRFAPLLSTFCFASLLNGCSSNDPKAAFDRQVQDVWIDFNGGRLEDAVEFLESGGRHAGGSSESEADRIDREVAIPLCKRLRDECQVSPQALVDKDLGIASMILVKLPDDPATHSAIETVIKEADAEYDGTIKTEWGHVWLAIELVEPGEERAE